ncbi:hypothetical protein M422DRAFT_129413, partial [Sphaerobolus stellatus SS14]
KDGMTRFWRTYERVAKDSDEQYFYTQDTQLNSILVFAGLFSAVSSTFIVDMESDLSADPMAITNTLLLALVHSNQTLNHDFTLPEFTGPTSSQLVIQSLAYLSLFTSLLAAFQAVLARQW